MKKTFSSAFALALPVATIVPFTELFNTSRLMNEKKKERQREAESVMIDYRGLSLRDSKGFRRTTFSECECVEKEEREKERERESGRR